MDEEFNFIGVGSSSGTAHARLIKPSRDARCLAVKMPLRDIFGKLTGKPWLTSGAALQGRMLLAATPSLALVAVLVLGASTQPAHAQPLPGDPNPSFDSVPGPGPDPAKQPFVDPLAPEPPDLLKPSDDKAPQPNKAPKPKIHSVIGDVTPPTKPLKTTDNALPTHDVRADISQTTQARLRELQIINRRMTGPDRNQNAARTDKQAYDRLYRQLHNERRAAIHAGIRETDPLAKKAYADKARTITDTLAKVTPLHRGTSAAEQYDDAEDSRIKSADRRRSDRRHALLDYRALRSEAGKVINTSDSGAAYDMLGKLKRDYNERQNRPVYKDRPDMKDYRDYIGDYERALERKWPGEAARRRRAGSTNDLPQSSHSYSRDPLTGELIVDQDADPNNPYGYGEQGNPLHPRGAYDPMRREGLGGYAPQPAGRIPDSFRADQLRNQRHLQQQRTPAPSDGNLPGAKQDAPEPPPIGKLPEVQGGPVGVDPVDMPVNNPVTF